MKFRMRRRKLGSNAKKNKVKPPEVITVKGVTRNPLDEVNNERWALQKLYASKLMLLSKMHLNDNRLLGRRKSLADEESIASDSSIIRPSNQFAVMNNNTTNNGNNNDKNDNANLQQENRIVTKVLTCGVAPIATCQAPCQSGEKIDEDKNELKSPQQLQRQQSKSSIRSAVQCAAQQVSYNLERKQRKDNNIKTNTNNVNNNQQNDPVEDTGSLPPTPKCLLFSAICPIALFADSSINETPGGFCCQPKAVMNRIMKTKSTNTRKNGIPKVIVVHKSNTIKNKTQKEEGRACCGAFSSSCSHPDEPSSPTAKEEKRISHHISGIQLIKSWDTSIARLEDILRKANMNADVEAKYDSPMHEPRPSNTEADVDPTVDDTSVSSSLSTRSSLKFGESFVRIPPMP